MIKVNKRELNKGFGEVRNIVNGLSCDHVQCEDCPFYNDRYQACNLDKIRDIVKVGRGNYHESWN